MNDVYLVGESSFVTDELLLSVFFDGEIGMEPIIWANIAFETRG